MTRELRGVRVGLLVIVGVVAAGCWSGSASASPTPSTTSTSSTAAAAAAVGDDYGPGRHLASFDVAGVRRSAVVVVPSGLSRPVPVVFVFHGHGGTGAIVERMVQLQGLWPEAIVVYPDGLVGHKGITDPAGVLPGWQTEAGESGDRDIAFYDTLVATLRARLSVDGDRVYVMGHSNGSAFASLLLNQRGAAIAATATISAQPTARMLATDPARSMFMAMGRLDPIVPYAAQKLSIPPAEKKLGADPGRATVTGFLRSEPGRGNLELATYIHPGGHEIPPEVPRLVVDFFRRHTLSGG